MRDGEHMTIPLDIEGPVEGEVFVVARQGKRLLLTGPDGPRPWRIELHGRDNPMEELRQVILRSIPDLQLLHSTSWRWQDQAVVLTFIGVAEFNSDQASRLITASALARGEATAAPTHIEEDQVLHHALRHLAWLAREDPAVKEILDADWHQALAGYVPATFQQIG